MLSRKCPKCKNKIKSNYDFCPYCGKNLSSAYDREDYGMLGKNDVLNDSITLGDSMFEKILNKTLKILEKQMKTISRDMNIRETHSNEINPNLNVQFFVNGKRIFPQPGYNNTKREAEIKRMPDEKLQKFAKLKKVEPNSRIRRLGQKLIYELEVPGVKDIEDILINKLENSIEIKALAGDKSYSKVINVNLPILKYTLNNGSLILELQAK